MTTVLYNADTSFSHSTINNGDDATRCERAGVSLVIIPTSLVFQITDTTNAVSNRNLDTITHVPSNQSRIDYINHRIEELEFNEVDVSDELHELSELFNNCIPLMNAERNRPNKLAENLAASYRSRMVELTDSYKARKEELASLKQELMLEQQKAILEGQANPPVLLTGEDIVTNYYRNVMTERD